MTESPARRHTLDRHYSVQEVADLWGLNPQTIRKIFQYEEGVLVIEKPLPQLTRTKRKPRATLRIPESVMHRVHERLGGGNTPRIQPIKASVGRGV